MNKDSIINICYLGIFFLVIMIFIPPIFRWVLPNEEVASNNSTEQSSNSTTTNNNDQTDNSLSQTLNCSLEQIYEGEKMVFNIVTDYENSKIKTIMFSYFLDNNDKLSTLKEKVSLLKEFDNLRNVTNAEYKLDDNIHTIKFDYQKYDFSNISEIQVYNKDSTTLINYLVDKGFIC